MSLPPSSLPYAAIVWGVMSMPYQQLTIRLVANVKPYTYGELVIATLPVMQHACVLFIFLSTFIHLLDQSLDPRLVLWTCVLGFVIGYIVWELLQSPEDAPVSIREQRKSLSAR